MDTTDEATGPTVLILDDEESIRRAAQKILELYGYRVLAAEHAHEALQVIESHEGPIDLLLCDLVLPGLSGREAASMLLMHAPGMRVLYTSGFSTHGSFRSELEASGDPFLPKPFDVHELVEAVDNVLSD